MDARMGNTEKHIMSIKSDISRILTSLSSSNRDRERSRSTSPRRTPSREVQCYACREYGHYSSTCPKKHLSPMNRNRSSSPSETRTDLNTNGLKMYAVLQSITEIQVNHQQRQMNIPRNATAVLFFLVCSHVWLIVH